MRIQSFILISTLIAVGLYHRPALAVDCTVPADKKEETEYDRLARRSKPNTTDPCETADTNIQKAIRSILALKAGSPGSRIQPWKEGQKVDGFDSIKNRFGLNKAETSHLSKEGFVVPAKLEFSNYGYAFHEIYQSEMPLYVSVDAILQAIYISNDTLIKRIESMILKQKLRTILMEMHCALPAASVSYSDATSGDLDLYLAIARSLLEDRDVSFALDTKDNARLQAKIEIIKKIKASSGLTPVELFGRQRIVDFSLYEPRGHYTEDAPYFRAATWLSRLELNLVSRSSKSSHPGMTPDPTETPREDLLALALADLANRANVMNQIVVLDKAWAVLAGPREDVSVQQIQQMIKGAGITDLKSEASAEKLRREIGNSFQRTVRMHYMPPGSEKLPVILTLLGPRIVSDSQSLMKVVHPEVNERFMPSTLDAASILGSARAHLYQDADFKKYQGLLTQTKKARVLFENRKETPDLYSSWLSAIGSINQKPAGAVPSFMEKDSFADLRLNSTVAAFGQIRHNYVLLAAQTYDEGGCRIPFGYVDPALSVYSALKRYAITGRELLTQIDSTDLTGSRSYFERTERLMTVFEKISQIELSGKPLPPEINRFLSMVTEMSPGGTGGPPTYTGWYFDLYLDRDDALKPASFIADFYTSVNEEKVVYAGASNVRLGIFVADHGTKPMAVVGPVTRSFGAVGGLDKRFNDESVSDVPKSDPWSVSYTIPRAAAPAMSVQYSGEAPGSVTIMCQGDKSLNVRIELLDHHRKLLLAKEVTLQPGKEQNLKMPLAKGKTAEMLHLVVGDFHEWSEISWNGTMFRTGDFKDN